MCRREVPLGSLISVTALCRQLECYLGKYHQRRYWAGLCLNPFSNVLDGLPGVEFVTVTLPLNESFSLRPLTVIFQDLLDGVPFPRRDLDLLDLLSVEPTLYGFFQGVFQLIPSDVVWFFDGENFFCPVRFIPSVEGFLGSQYSRFLTFLDRNLFLLLFFSLEVFW